MDISGVHGNGISKASDKIKDKYSDIVQKDIESTAKEFHSIGMQTTFTETDSMTYKDQIQKTAEDNSKEAVQEITEEDRWKKNANIMSEEDYQDLSKEGFSLEDYNSERLDRALTRIKSQRIVKEDNLEGQKEQIKTKCEAVKDMVNDNDTTKKIVQKLKETDLPVTEENIERIANAMEMASTATQMSDRAMNYLIKNNLEPTIENIYKAQYSGNYSDKKGVSEETWNGLIGQVNEIISSAGLEVNDENLESAKRLLNNQLPLTEDNLWALRDLKLIKNGIGEEETLNKTVEALISGITPVAASLGFTAVERVKQTITAFYNISEEAIDLAVHTNQNRQMDPTIEINCHDLQEAQKLVVGQKELEDSQEDSNTPEKRNTLGNSNTSENSNSQENRYLQANMDIQTITARRQLEEIRLKMTLEAGQQLIKQGFNLETDGLSKIVDGLKEIEDQYYSNLLKERNATVSTENLETLKETIQGVEELKSMPNYILGSTLPGRRIETVSGLLAAGTECKQTLDKAKVAYEALMTSPRADMGDSISKAFRNVDAILEDMKLETTKANERAVKILGYNQIEITEENIQKVKSYDEQVNHMIKNLHPSVTVELIKKGINPMIIPVEELNLQIDEIKSELGVSEEEKYGKYLWKLEKEHGINEQEKKSYIGIYRLLNTLDKTDGAALGAVLNANQEVTMKNLLTAVRTLKSGGIRASVDDTFGALEQLTFTRESITSQVEAAFRPVTQTTDLTQNNDMPSSKEDKFDYVKSLLRNVMNEITPANLQAMGNTDDIMNMSVERLQENLLDSSDKDGSEQAYWTQKLENYQEVNKQADNAMQLLKDYEIPSSIHNIQAANDILSTDQSIYKQWKKLLENGTENSSQLVEPTTEQIESDVAAMSKNLINALTNHLSMTAEYERMEQDVNKVLTQAYENPVITAQDITTLQRISNGMSFLQRLAKKESYEIPILIGDKVTNVNLTIIRNTEETGKVDISIASETLGKVTAGFSVKEQELKGLITCDNRFGLEAIQSVSEDLKEVFKHGGLKVKSINYGIDNKIIDSYRYKNPNTTEEIESEDSVDEKAVSTDILYTLAKAVLIQIRTIEMKYS